jgi:hypothetical protein
MTRASLERRSVLRCVIMFLARNFRNSNMQKARCTRDKLIDFTVKHKGLLQFSHVITALQGGFLNTRCVAYLFTYCKKLYRLSQKTSKVWLNLPSTNILTKKALNVRMGKGKGSKFGVNARVYPGNIVLAASAIRPGLWQKTVRFATARCAFRLYAKIVAPTYFSMLTTNTTMLGSNTPHPVSRVRVKSTRLSTPRYIVPQIFELYGMLRKLRKIKLFLYFYKIFKSYQPRFRFLGKIINFPFRELHGIWRMRQRSVGAYFFLTRSSAVFGKHVDRLLTR